jgi:CRP-like cAMP-binding protein
VPLEDDIAILSRAPLIGGLERDALRLIAFAAEARNLARGAVLFRKGDRSDGGYVVTRGAIELDPHEDGSPPAFVAHPGALIGQVALFLRTTRAATATAREHSAVIRISPTLIKRMVDEYPRTATVLYEATAAELSKLTSGLEGIRQQLLAVGAR